MSDHRFELVNVPETNFDRMREIFEQGVNLCEMKNREYGASWSRRGGVGAFFTVWRKVDRLEAQLKNADFNFFDLSVDKDSTESLDETIKDLILYLGLVLEKREALFNLQNQEKTSEPDDLI